MEEGEGGEEGRKALSIELCREGRGGVSECDGAGCAGRLTFSPAASACSSVSVIHWCCRDT